MLSCSDPSIHDPDRTEIFKRMALELYAQNIPSLAIKYFHSALEAQLDSHLPLDQDTLLLIYMFLGLAYKDDSNPSSAIEYLEKAIQ